LYLPLTWYLFRSKVHNLSQLAKRLGGWVRAHNLAGHESRGRNRNPLNNVSHLRWQPEKF
jgi:hypothetical protein